MRSCALCRTSSDGPAPLSSSRERDGAALAAAPHISAALDCCRSTSFSLPPERNRYLPRVWQQPGPQAVAPRNYNILSFMSVNIQHCDQKQLCCFSVS